MHPDTPHFRILLCLMPDDFTHTNSMGSIALHPSALALYYVTLSNTDNFPYQQESTGAQ